jgi:hypothetical protein
MQDSPDWAQQAAQRLQAKMAAGPRPDPALKDQMIAAMRANGADPAYIHAFEKTGLLVFQETMHLIEEEELKAWEAAYLEYSP